jgi:hypothetical protein
MDMKMDKCILVWSFYDAPEVYRNLSQHGGDEDWLALVPKDYPHTISWLERGSFGVCDITIHDTEDGTVYIGAHA